ncbi:MAG: 50S ribosomal protein L18Ae [Candidatus Micrarchaeia archaeon]
MKYVLHGKIRARKTFKVNVDANNEKHAMELAITKLGSKSKIKKHEIKIEEIKKA